MHNISFVPPKPPYCEFLRIQHQKTYSTCSNALEGEAVNGRSPPVRQKPWCRRGPTVLAIHAVLAALVETVVRVPANQVVLGVVVHRHTGPILQMAKA